MLSYAAKCFRSFGIPNIFPFTICITDLETCCHYSVYEPEKLIVTHSKSMLEYSDTLCTAQARICIRMTMLYKRIKGGRHIRHSDVFFFFVFFL